MKFLKSVILTSILVLSSMALASTSDMKKEYQELKTATNKKIVVLEKKLNKLNSKLADLSGEAKEKTKESYEDLLELKEDLKEKLSELGDTSSDKWASTKKSISKMTNNLEDKIEKALQ